MISDSRIAVCSWSLQPIDPQALIRCLHQMNMDAVQLALSPLVTDRPTWSSAIEQLRDAGIGIVSGMMQTQGEDYSTLQSIAETGGLRPDATWPHNREHAAAVAEVAADAGIELVTFHAGFLPDDASDPERERVIGRIQVIANVFASHNIDIALETGQEHAENLLVVLEELNQPNVGVNFDPANMILYGMGDPVQALTLLRDHVRQVHIKDAIASEVPGSWGTEVPVGDGHVPWDEFLKVVASIQPAADLVIEREAGSQRMQDILIARDMLTRLGWQRR